MLFIIPGSSLSAGDIGTEIVRALKSTDASLKENGALVKINVEGRFHEGSVS